MTRAATTTAHRSARSAPVRGAGAASLVRPLLPQRRETPGVQKEGTDPSPEHSV